MNIQSICETLGKSGCLIFCDAYLAEVPEIKVIEKFNELLEKRVIKDDCFILDHDNLIRILTDDNCNKNYEFTEEKPVNQNYIANYIYGKANHYVVKYNNEIVFNSLDLSNCVNNGTEEKKYRILK